MNTFTPKTMLITGGAGFIGSHFVLMMLKHYPQMRVINVDKLTYAADLNTLTDAQTEQYQFYKFDICDASAMENLIRTEKVDCIVHFAAESHVDRSIAGPEIFIKTNVLGTFTLLEAARKVWLTENHWDETQCRFHHISTDEVYGTLEKTDPAFSEVTPYAPNSPYSASKAGSDHIVRAYFHTYGLPVTLSNCSNNYGPHQHEEKLIPTIIRKALNKASVPIYGDGSNIRDWLFVTDHCTAIDRIIRHAKTGETYNIGGNAERDNLTMARLILKTLAQITHTPESELLDLITFVKDRAGHDFRYAIDAEKIKHDLSWEPCYTLEKGLDETIRWYLARWNMTQCA